MGSNKQDLQKRLPSTFLLFGASRPARYKLHCTWTIAIIVISAPTNSLFLACTVTQKKNNLKIVQWDRRLIKKTVLQASILRVSLNFRYLTKYFGTNLHSPVSEYGAAVLLFLRGTPARKVVYELTWLSSTTDYL